MKIFGWERDLKDPLDWLEILVLIPLRYFHVLNYRPEGALIRQGLNFTWARGPIFILEIGKWRGRIRYRIKLKPHFIFGYQKFESTGEQVAVNTKIKSSPIDWSKPSCSDQKQYYEIIRKMKDKYTTQGY